MSKKREKGGSQNWKFYLIVLVAVLVRLCVGLGSFSGEEAYFVYIIILCS